ncbi:MAG TPA: beta-L-arabinofuranosidase domain-containing protein, partial [Vicinamibacterales bacterium]|nr:beta-L-arabinofuranosidase domain-containing protein [Vicinamibacterales bacterium]
MTRRELLRHAGCGAVAALAGAMPLDAAARAIGLQRPARAAAARLMPVALSDVRLLDGPFLDAQRRDLAYLLSLQPDRMLHNFRVNAGLAPKAPVYGGWESEEPWVGIRCHGHTLGHYLTAASLMYASTGDVRMKQRVDYIAEELHACQQASGVG